MSKRRIVTLSFEDKCPEGFLDYADVVKVLPARPPIGMQSLQDAIKMGMMRTVWNAEPGDVVAQDDMVFDRDPFESPLTPGTITMLNPQKNPRHWCPRAFRFATYEDAEWIIREWMNDPLRTCYGWQAIPKQLYECGDTHG